MNRRLFLRHAAVASGLPFVEVASESLASESSSRREGLASHLPARVVSAPDVPLPPGKRESFGWKTAAVSAVPLVLEWKDWPDDAKPAALRLTVGLDIRDEKLIEAYLPGSNRVLGTFDIRFGSLFQVYEIPLAPADAADLRREGVALRLTKGAELRVFTGGEGMPAALQPHLLLPGTADVMTEYFARMETLACVQAFSWQEGCVLDGLLDLAVLPAHVRFKEAARRHFARFITGGKLIYEDTFSVPREGRAYGIEGTLPFAALAKLEPGSPLLEVALTSWAKAHDAEHAILDGQHTSSEGAYTVGYPLAVIGRLRKDEALEQLALTQLRVRQARLFDGKMFWRTSEPHEGAIRKGNRAWARGLAWQMLGFARTLRELKDRKDIGDLLDSFRQLAAWVLPFQRADGLWSVFVDQPGLPPDTSGSAGIAAALAIGAQEGWLDEAAKEAAARTLVGLKKHLTPDGFLGGVAQANKGGEGLQRGEYRVIYQMGMGLMAQLIAALE